MRFDYFKDKKGSMAAYFACALMVVCMGTGVAVDMAGVQKLQTKYQDIADAAVLSAAKSRPKEQGPMHTIATAVITKLNDTGTTPTNTTTLSSDRKTLEVTMDGQYKTSLMGMFGKSNIQVKVVARTLIEVADYTDIVLVLDTTASMSYEGRLPALKASALNFIDIIEDLDSDKIRMSVVPYAQYVNVGTSVRSKPWLDVPNDWVQTFNPVCTTSTPQTGTAPPCSEQSYGPTPASPATPATPATYGTCSNDGVSYSCQTSSGSPGSPGHPGSPGGTRTVCTPTYGPPVTTCTTRPPIHHRWTGAVGSRNAPGNLEVDFTSGSAQVPGFLDVSGSTQILPLTQNLGSVRSKISSLAARDWTYSPQGLIWGWRMLSEGEPFPSTRTLPPRAELRKVVVFMTDGLNTMTLGPKIPPIPTTSGPGGSNGGPLAGDGPSHINGARNQADSATAQICAGLNDVENMKVYTVTFKVFDNTAKNLVEGCATEPEYYYNATSAASLHTAFEEIALDLLSPRITH